VGVRAGETAYVAAAVPRPSTGAHALRGEAGTITTSAVRPAAVVGANTGSPVPVSIHANTLRPGAHITGAEGETADIVAIATRPSASCRAGIGASAAVVSLAQHPVGRGVAENGEVSRIVTFVPGPFSRFGATAHQADTVATIATTLLRPNVSFVAIIVPISVQTLAALPGTRRVAAAACTRSRLVPADIRSV
jgi:hypothetical protein